MLIQDYNTRSPEPANRTNGSRRGSPSPNGRGSSPSPSFHSRQPSNVDHTLFGKFQMTQFLFFLLQIAIKLKIILIRLHQETRLENYKGDKREDLTE